jgi:DNA repair exonuclease SbcCD nuclease subunit
MRVFDGWRGLERTVDDILANHEEAPIDAVVHAGDLFHRSNPTPGDIAIARRQLERFARAGIPVFANTGNHDFANEKGKAPATLAVHDPDRNINMVTDPHQVFRVSDGLIINMVSHVGLLARTDRPTPEPVEGAVNLFCAHGAAQVPGHEMFACVDSPGEAVISAEFLNMPWHATLLGHYHGMGPLPGMTQGMGQAWYAGSLLRRGFSDAEGGRGWLLVTVEDNNNV